MVESDGVVTVSNSTPFLYLYAPSSFDPRDHSLIKTMEYCPDSKPSSLTSNAEVSEMNLPLLVTSRYMVFGSCPVYRSQGDFLLADGSIWKANRTSDKPDLSFLAIICLLVFSLSFIVRISLSILPFLLWSPIGHSTWVLNQSLQTLNFVLLNMVAVAALSDFRIPCRVIYLFRNSMTFSALGLRKTFPSDHPVW